MMRSKLGYRMSDHDIKKEVNTLPELPEVETVKRTLNELITGKTIAHVQVRLPRIIQKPDDIQQFEMLLARTNG